MPENLHRPVVKLAEDGSRSFETVPVLLHRMTVTLASYDTQTRAELIEWRPGQPVSGRMIWQYHVEQRNLEHTAAVFNAEAMAKTVSHLAKEGWPGVVF